MDRFGRSESILLKVQGENAKNIELAVHLQDFKRSAGFNL